MIEEFLIRLDAKLQNASPSEHPKLRKELIDLRDEIIDRLVFIENEIGAGSPVLLAPQLSPRKVATITHEKKLGYDGLDDFQIKLCDTVITGRLTSLLVPGRDHLIRANVCKKCPDTGPIHPECNYYHYISGARRNIVIENREEFAPVGAHRDNWRSKERMGGTKYVFQKKPPAKNRDCRLFGCAAHIDQEIQFMSKDDFSLLRQILLNAYIYYSSVVNKRPDLLK